MQPNKNINVINPVKKRIAVSQKRQITIPIEFYTRLGMDKEVECYVQNNVLIIRPVRDNDGSFDEEILADLIARGLSGEELLTEFKAVRRKIRPAVEALLDDARLAARGKKKAFSYDEIFGHED